MDDYESPSHSKWGANIMWFSFPSALEDVVRGAEAASLSDVPHIGDAEGVQGRGGPFDA